MKDEEMKMEDNVTEDIMETSESEVDDVTEVTEAKKKNTPLIILGVICIIAIIGIVVYLVLDGIGVFSKGSDKVKKVGDYKNFTYEEFDTTVTDEEVYETYESYISYYAGYGITGYEKDESRDGTLIKDGDIVNIDYTGYLDGEAFENGADTGYNLTIGSGAFIDGFESSLIGKTVGETVDINVTFPEEYSNNPDMAGKEVVFTVTINYISKEVELTVDNAYSQIFGSDSLEECLATLKTQVEQSKISYTESYIESMKNEYLLYIIENSEFEDLTKEVEEYSAKIMSMIEAMASENSMDVETFVVNNYGYESLDAYKQELNASCLVEKQKDHICNEIAAIENIKMSDKDFEELSKEIIEYYGYSDVSEYQTGYDEQYGEGSFRQYMFDIYVIDILFEKYATETPAVATGATAE